MPHANDDTIVAVSSPPGRSPRGLIRLSGPDARAILSRLTDAQVLPRILTRCRLRAGVFTLPALLAFFASPRSYTGQDLAEIQLPGNPALLDRVLHALLAAGARPAEPGEFTFRAYLAGKLDLTQAEGIAATIAATSDSQLQAAALLREGKLGQYAAQLVDALGAQLALVEAGIDFTDQDDVVPITPGRLDANLAAIEATLRDLLSHSRSWGAIEALPRVVLVGEPSAGKSTLFNALLNRQRAVISEQPGTTRDLLAEPLTLRTAAGRQVEVMLIDIAGLDEPRNLIDEQMQATAHSAMRSADLILRITPHGPGLGRGPISCTLAKAGAMWSLPPSVPVIDLISKSDAPANDDDHLAASHTHEPLHVSAHTGRNMEALRTLIAGRLGERAVSVVADMLALQPRHESALRVAAADLAASRQLLAPQRLAPSMAHVELIAGALRGALDQLAALGGMLTPDDVIGRVFATFCVGK